MQFIKLIISALAILLFSSTSVLVAQTYKQQLKSTEIINRMFEGKLKFNPKQTRRITASQLQKEIQANNLIPAYLRENIYHSLVSSVADIKDWRGIVAEATADCGAVRVFFTSSINDNTGQVETDVHIFIPPNNKCGKFIEVLYPILYKDIFEGKNIKVVRSKSCLNLSSEVAVCADVLLLTEDKGQAIYTSNSCENNTDCSKADDDDFEIIWWDLMMDKK